MPQEQAQTLHEELNLLTQSWRHRGETFWAIIIGSFIINLLGVAFPIALLQVYDRIIPNRAFNTLTLLLLGVVAVLLFEMCLKILRSYLKGWTDAKNKFFMQINLFNRLLRAELKDFSKEDNSAHVRQLEYISLLQDFSTGQSLSPLTDIPFLILFLGLIGYIGGWLVVVPIIVLGIYLVKVFPHLKKIKDTLDKNKVQQIFRDNFIIETLENINSIKAMALEAQMLRRYERLQTKSIETDYAMSINNSGLQRLTKNLTQTMIVAIIASGSIFVIHGHMTIGSLAASMLLGTRCIQPIGALTSLWLKLKLVKIAKEESEKISAWQPESDTSLPSITQIEGNIRLENVSYSDSSEPENQMLNNINLSVKAKECIAILAGQGTGKSTLLSLIGGTLKPSKGSVFIDDIDTSTIQLESVRRQVAYLPQKPVLFNGSIIENLTMFQEDKDALAAKKISRIIGLDQIIRELPEGYNTPVGNRTTETLPIGIQQRIAIARALVHEPPIVLFDEANGAIDIQGDEVIKQLLQKMVGQCTLIIVSHRPSILNFAKKTYELTSSGLHEREQT